VRRTNGTRRNADRPTSASRQALNITLVVAGAYLVWAVHYLQRHSPSELADVGRRFLAQGHGTSASIDALAPHAKGPVGYDGQFNLFLALDPRHAHHYIDEPAYRTSRILTSMLARAIALGQPRAVPTTLLVVNIVAVVAGTLLVAKLLQRHGLSAWLAVLYGCSPALFVAVYRDLNEPVAYAFAIAALLALDHDRLIWAAALFGLAGISRETTLLFPLAIGVALLLGLGTARRPPAKALGFLALSLLPYVALRLALLGIYGRDPPPGPPREWVPFGGLWKLRPLDSIALEVVYVVVLPALLAVFVILVVSRRVTPLTLALVLNVVGLVVLLPASSYRAFLHAGRITLGVVVATLACVELVPGRVRTPLLAVLAVLWFAPWDFWFPYAFLS
jgi:hypothetical protein